MAREDNQQSKVGFLRELFSTDPDVKLAAANAAWSEAGYEGKISDSSFYVAKKEFDDPTVERAGGGTASPKAGAVKKRNIKAGRATRKSTPTNGQEPKPTQSPRTQPSRAADREQVLVEAEADIDDLLNKLREQGGMTEVLESLRRARRILVRQHEG